MAANLVSCALYMFAYEFMFRGFLLFACLVAMPALFAVAINVALYALAHAPKCPREALGSIPLGVVLCLSAIETGAIWAATALRAPRSTSERYPRLTRAEFDTSRKVRPCVVRARRRTSPITSRSSTAIAVLLISSQHLCNGGGSRLVPRAGGRLRFGR